MIELKFKEFTTPLVEVYMGKLMQFPNFNQKNVYDVMKLSKALLAAQKEFEELRLALIKKYAKKTEDGALECMKDPEGKDKPGTFIIADEHVEEWKKSIEELMDVTTPIDRNKLVVDSLMKDGLKLSGNDLIILDSVLEPTDPGPALKVV